ncbi:MAG: phage tail assembly protein [Candidatus Pacebacteria bacterium]|nr:phage tail assembly protein [Candidatus Paceibacterota bacterium]
MSKSEIKIPLKTPINLEDTATKTVTKITEIVLRRPTAGDMRHYRLTPDRPLDGNLTFAEILSGQPAVIIDKLDFEDAAAVLEAVDGFLKPFLRTGKTSSET